MNEKNDLKQIIAERIKEARELSGLSQGQASKLLKMHRPTISEIEAGNRNVSAVELSQFAELYDVNISWLSGQMTDPKDTEDLKQQLAFRELQKLNPEEVEKFMNVFRALHGTDKDE
ncbi:MAG: helix-turn-helix transcriptional regulator [Verrucomicrobiales bacterium]|nr:helix-turn-helix transcriptional regulator [Verrucomicrobiales bacterium]